ncbi:MAG: RNA polymerase subunit sigma-24 [Peptococcaceae bacterium BICA1-7]|nr:MAG: RNA polymerase subunit sigma-24 [Peptococcaceae bacterium BICA1-7]HBV99066.1 sigma-70 family RNA polymerase sigma factor [Desulfotomaculum sp.]
MRDPCDTDPEKLVFFEDLYDQYFERVNRYLRYRVTSVWDADDLTAAVFTRAFEKRHHFRGEAPVAVWLFRIAHNIFVDYIRSKGRLTLSEPENSAQAAEDGQPEEELLRLEELRQLRRLLETLAPDYRDVISLRYVGELRFSQIGRVLDRTEAAVRMIHHRALKALRKKLCEEEG